MLLRIPSARGEDPDIESQQIEQLLGEHPFHPTGDQGAGSQDRPKMQQGSVLIIEA